MSVILCITIDISHSLSQDISTVLVKKRIVCKIVSDMLYGLLYHYV